MYLMKLTGGLFLASAFALTAHANCGGVMVADKLSCTVERRVGNTIDTHTLEIKTNTQVEIEPKRTVLLGIIDVTRTKYMPVQTAQFEASPLDALTPNRIFRVVHNIPKNLVTLTIVDSQTKKPFVLAMGKTDLESNKSHSAAMTADVQIEMRDPTLDADYRFECKQIYREETYCL